METKERTEGRLRRLLEQPGTFLKWVLFAGVIGLAAGGVSTAFYYALNAVTALREANPWLLWLLPLGGVAIVLLYRICGMEKDRGTNFVLVAVRENQPLRLRTAPLIFAATVLTHLLGGSSGREGAILQIGGSISSKIGQWMRLDDKDSRIITMCGMAAAFSALFGTPLTAAMFAMEVTSVGVLYYAAMVPCILSAIVGLWMAQAFHVPATSFTLEGIPNLTKTERRIFDGYVAGLRSREIVEQLDIKDSTLRFHNKNIYDKLGVSSLKQLQQFVAILNSGSGSAPDESGPKKAR